MATTKDVTTNKTEIKDDTREKELELIKKENALLREQMSSVMEMLQKLSHESDSKKTETAKKDPVIVKEMPIPEEPSTSKMVRIVSLCYGSLNLSVEGKTRLQFSKYGEIKPVLYSTLIDIVNENRSFAESGKFYILDNGAVYHLGLDSSYKKIIPNDIIDNICNYSDAEISDIIKNVTTEIKETMVRILADKVYNGEKVDYNKIALISNLCDKDIQSIVKEMQGVNDNLS